MRAGLAAKWALSAAVAFPSASAGQEWRGQHAGPEDARVPFRAAQASVPPGSLAPVLFSLAVPGAGQHVLGQQRKWAYLALELAGWALYVERRGAGREYRDRYRDLAWDRGRIQTASRVDGDFGYYETLTKWTRSGAFDRDPGLPGLQPETDAATYNGSIWALAGQIYLSGGGTVPETDPAYLDALEYYQGRAYGTALLWDWSQAPGGQAELGELITSSDDRFRQATTALGVVIANHLFSAADAYLASRGSWARARFRFLPGLGIPGQEWFGVLSVPVGR